MGGHYPDRPPQASDGKSFEALGSWFMQHFLGEEILVFADESRNLRLVKAERVLNLRSYGNRTSGFILRWQNARR